MKAYKVYEQDSSGGLHSVLGIGNDVYHVGDVMENRSGFFGCVSIEDTLDYWAQYELNYQELGSLDDMLREHKDKRRYVLVEVELEGILRTKGNRLLTEEMILEESNKLAVIRKEKVTKGQKTKTHEFKGTKQTIVKIIGVKDVGVWWIIKGRGLVMSQIAESNKYAFYRKMRGN